MFKLGRSLVVALSLIVATAASADDDPCPCVPLSYTWLAEPCRSWNCAASAMVLANGSADVLVMPTASERFKWVVLRRVVTGSVTVAPNAPFLVENFGSMTDGTARFATIDNGHVPMLMTTTDGNTLVVYLREREERNRAVTH